MSLEFMGLLLHMYGPDITTYGSNFKSPYHPSSLNCQCDLVAHSFPTMETFALGDTIPLIFSAVYDLYSDISKPHDIWYRFMKVLHQIGKKIHGLIHDMAATLEADFVESFDALWERVCKDIFSIIDYAFRKNHSYYAPSSSYDDLQGPSPHVLCLQHIDALMHDLCIHNIFTNSITKKLLFQIIQVKKKTY